MIKLSDELYIPTMGEIIRDRDADRKRRRRGRREYAGGRVDRFNSGWTTRSTTSNYEIRRSIGRLRARARELARDNAHASKFLGMVRSNVIGPNGIQLQVTARAPDGTLNSELNKRVEDAFAEWSHRETCSMSHKLDWLGAQRLFVTHLARDGEVLVQKVTANNGWGFALKFLDVTYLDEFYNEVLSNGNRVIMSVEIDIDDRPVAYWLTTPASDINFVPHQRRIRTRVRAEEFLHAFLVYDDESQVRGITWFAAAMLNIKNLDEYSTAVLASARVGAMAMGFIVRDEDEPVDLEGVEDEEGREADIEIDVAPASFHELPVGTTIKEWDPKQPTQNHSEFKRTIEADIASAVSLNYFSLFGDMAAVNYSSARVGLGEERDMWRVLQDFVATRFCREIYHAWLPQAMLAGKLRIKASDYMEVQNPRWRGRGWGNIDPLKEVNAEVTGLQNNIRSLTSVLSERGVDVEDHFRTIQMERELAAKYDIDLNYVSTTTERLDGPAPDDGEDTPPKEKKADPAKTE